MRVLIVLILLSVSLTAQTRQGYFNASVDGVRVGSNRTTLDKAYTDCLILKLQNPNSVVAVLPPTRWVVIVPDELTTLPQFAIESITHRDITATSIVIDVQLNTSNLKAVYVRFRKVGGLWQRTNEDPAKVYWIGLLDPASTYEYMVYGEDNNGVKINSDLLTFKTL